MVRRGDNFSFEHVETEKRKGKRNAGGSAENLELGGSIRPGLIVRQQLGLTRLRVVLPGLSLLKEGTAGTCLQPSHPIAHGLRAVSPEVQHIRDMTRMYSLFIGSYL